MNTSYSAVFANVFNSIETAVEFSTEWKNGTGYLDHLVYEDLGIAEGKLAKTIDDMGRRIIIVGTALGNAVIFERYTYKEDGQFVVVSNTPVAIRASGLVMDGSMSVEDFKQHTGADFCGRNVGQAVRAIRQSLTAGEVRAKRAVVDAE
jgi:hypothetical protein